MDKAVAEVPVGYWDAKAEGWTFFWSKHNHWSVSPTDRASYAGCEWWQPFDPYTGKPNDKPHPWEALRDFNPSCEWYDGGPIIEKEGISITNHAQGGMRTLPEWCAKKVGSSRLCFGPTPLIAAMRAFVASRFGDRVGSTGE